MKVWLVWERVDWQGDSLRGAYTTGQLAQAAVEALGGGDNWSLEEIDVYDTFVLDAINSWHGN